MAIGNVNLMKEINLDTIRRVLKEIKKATKPQLASLTGLSVVTINSLMEVLCQKGEVLEDELDTSGGGRPAVTYSFNEDFSHGLIIYTSEYEKMEAATVAVINLYGEIIERNEIILHEVYESSFDMTIERMLNQYPNIKAIGMGMPGLEIQGKMELSDYKNLEGKGFIEYLRNKFHIPVVFENDINAAVRGYCTSNQYEDKNVVAIYIPIKHPLGVGIFINGDVYKGKDGFAGEAKYLPDGIKWRDPDFVSKNIVSAIENLIITFTCLLNPDHIVIYRENLEQGDIPPILERCKEVIDRKMLPQVTVSKEFTTDFANGIKQIALGLLEAEWKA